MRIVIDISEDIREQLLDICNFGLEIPLGLQNKMIMAITNGTPLPKGHGRLIDADEFHYTLEDMPIRDNDKWFNWLRKACNRLAEAPTIIEADKGGRE